MNFQWISVKLFGTEIKTQISGHCAGIINNKLYVFGGSDENTKYASAKLFSIELDLFRNKKLTRIYQYAQTVGLTAEHFCRSVSAAENAVSFK